MADAFMEAGRRVLNRYSDARFARAMVEAGAPGVTLNQVARWRRGEVELPAWALVTAARAANTTVDELIAAATGDRGALTRRVDSLEQELREVRADLAKWDAWFARVEAAPAPRYEGPPLRIPEPEAPEN